MSDWVDGLLPEQHEEWERFVRSFREDALSKMTESAFVAQLVPKDGKFDVKFAVELGAAIMLNKPILAIVMPGSEVPAKLRLIADVVVEEDIDTQEGQKRAAKAIAKMAKKLGRPR